MKDADTRWVCGLGMEVFPQHHRGQDGIQNKEWKMEGSTLSPVMVEKVPSMPSTLRKVEDILVMPHQPDEMSSMEGR
jgi:hypothetical protein